MNAFGADQKGCSLRVLCEKAEGESASCSRLHERFMSLSRNNNHAPPPKEDGGLLLLKNPFPTEINDGISAKRGTAGIILTK